MAADHVRTQTKALIVRMRPSIKQFVALAVAARNRVRRHEGKAPIGESEFWRQSAVTMAELELKRRFYEFEAKTKG